MLIYSPDPKRKAAEQLDPPTPSKRIKNAHSVLPEDKKPLTIVPYPEKVRIFTLCNDSSEVPRLIFGMPLACGCGGTKR